MELEKEENDEEVYLKNLFKKNWPRIKNLVYFAVYFIGGAVFYHFIMDISWARSFYMSLSIGINKIFYINI